MIEPIKDILNFCNSAVLYDYKNVGVIFELNKVRKCIFNNFHETIPTSKILVSQGIIDDMILKIHDNDLDDIVDKIHDLRENIIYMIG